MIGKAIWLVFGAVAMIVAATFVYFMVKDLLF